MPRLAANLSFLFGEVPFLERFAAAAGAGFSGVEFLFPYDHPAEAVAAAAAAAEVEVVLFNLPPGDWDGGERGLACLPGRRDEFREGLARALDYAGALGTPRLHMLAGFGRWEDGAARGAYLDAVAEAADRLGEAGRTLLLEPINGRDMPGYFLDSFERAAEVVEASGRPNVRLQFDVYHRQILRGDVLKGLEALLPLVGHVQIAAVPDRGEPGTGELDDARVLAALDRLGYGGWVGCEYRPRAGTREGLGWMAPFRQAGGG